MWEETKNFLGQHAWQTSINVIRSKASVLKYAIIVLQSQDGVFKPK